MKSKTELNQKILNIVSEVKRTQSIKEFPGVSDQLKETEDEIRDAEFRVTVVGEFSSGKSTFLNSIIGKDILPHGVKETTATVTYIHNVRETDKRINTAVVNFRGDNKSTTIDLYKEKLVDYVTTSAKTYKVVKDIASVEVYVNFLDIDQPVVLIDTPGMNGVAEGHRDITLHEIRHSHASICLFHLRGIGNSDLEFIRELMKYQDTFFFVLNAIDDLKSSEETYEDRLKAFADDITVHVYDNKRHPQYVFGVSALKALAARDLKIKRLYDTDTRDLTNSDRQRILEESKMPELERVLFDFLKNSDREKNFYTAVCQRLINIIEGYIRSVDVDKGLREAKIEDIPKKKTIQNEMSETEAWAKDYREKIKVKVKSMISTLQGKLYEKIASDTERKQNSLFKFIDGMAFEDAKDASEKNLVGKRLQGFYNEMKSTLVTDINDGISHIQESISADIQRFIPAVRFKDKKVLIEIDTDSTFEHDATNEGASRLNRLKGQREEAERNLNKVTGGQTVEAAMGCLNANNEKIRNARNEHQRSIAALGYRPSVKTKTCRKKNNGWTNLWGLFGDRYDEWTVRDDSAQRKYDAQKQQLDDEYNNKVASLRKMQEILERNLENAEEREGQRDMLRRKIAELDRKIADEQRHMEEWERQSRSSFLEKMKRQMRNQVSKVLQQPDGQIYIDLRAGVRDSLDVSISQLQDKMCCDFDQKKANFLRSLKEMISRIDGSNDAVENKRQIDIRKTDINKLNNCTNQIKNIINGL